MAPPLSPEFPERMELEMVRMPELLKAPPLPVIFAPVTVTPEMERLPPESMLKILKLFLLASIVSEVAPRPVMVREPELDAAKMLGSDEFKVIL